MPNILSKLFIKFKITFEIDRKIVRKETSENDFSQQLGVICISKGKALDPVTGAVYEKTVFFTAASEQ
jgi:hypothetical protein